MNMFDTSRVIGIDFGNTIFHTVGGKKVVFENAFEVIHRLVKSEQTVVHIISKVTEQQKVRAIEWMAVTDFYRQTGLTPKNIHFCAERKDKAAIAAKLNLTHHIDDRPEVMSHMDGSIYKYLFRPEAEDVLKFYNDLRRHHVKIVNTWWEVKNEFLP